MNEKYSQYCDFMEETFRLIGWERLCGEQQRGSSRALNDELSLCFAQVALYVQIVEIYVAEQFIWKLPRFAFPLSSQDVDELRGRITFEVKWRQEWEESTVFLPTAYTKQLPTLPPILGPEEITRLLQERKAIQKNFILRHWSIFRWFSPLFYKMKWGSSAQKKKKLAQLQIHWERIQEKRDVLCVIMRWQHLDSKLRASMRMWEQISGFFLMGSEKQHVVSISKRLEVCVQACTQRLFAYVMDNNPSFSVDEDGPVENVTWCEAVYFCNRLSLLEGFEPAYHVLEPFSNSQEWAENVNLVKESNGYRLPTDAEWEYCAKKSKADFGIDEEGMLKSVAEWVWDSHMREYTKASVIDPVVYEPRASHRLTRGGCRRSDLNIVLIAKHHSTNRYFVSKPQHLCCCYKYIPSSRPQIVHAHINGANCRETTLKLCKGTPFHLLKEISNGKKSSCRIQDTRRYPSMKNPLHLISNQLWLFLKAQLNLVIGIVYKLQSQKLIEGNLLHKNIGNHIHLLC